MSIDTEMRAHRSYRSGAGKAMLALCLSFCATGCLSSLNKHGLAVSKATTPVIDEAATAYRTAQALHNAKVDADIVAQFDKTKTVAPDAVVSFPSDQAIHVRLTVLEAFKCYVQSVVDITSGVGSPKLDTAASSVGSSLTSLGNRFAPTATDPLAITAASDDATTTSTTAAPVISKPVQNVLSTSALALGEFLVDRKIKKELPGRIEKMDANLKTLSDAMLKDIDILKKQEQRDYEDLRDRQTLFVQGTMMPGATPLDPQQHRVQILKIPELIRQHEATQTQLAELRSSILNLYLTHHALAAEAQKNNPQSLKVGLAELAAAGSDLGKFYSSLPTQ